MRLLLAKDCLREVKLKNGDGISESASEDFEILPSLLPVLRGMCGPPSYVQDPLYILVQAIFN